MQAVRSERELEQHIDRLEKQLERGSDRGHRASISAVMVIRTILWVALTLGAIWLGLQGVLVLTKATEGVGMIGLGCLAGIIARIIQASRSS